MTATDLPLESAANDASEPAVARVLLYSDNSDTRAEVCAAIGVRPSKTSPTITWHEVATHAAVVSAADEGGFDLLILDGEAQGSGGMGLCRQLKNELRQCPPVLVLIGRTQDAWLASWSNADAVVSHPIDPMVLAATVAELLGNR